jgi:hypothetical protein
MKISSFMTHDHALVNMEAIEPIRFTAEGPGINVDGSYDGSHIGGNWDETHNFLLNRVISDYFDIVDGEYYFDKFRDLIEEELEPIQNVLGPDQEDIVTGPYRMPIPGPAPVFLREDTIAVPHEDIQGVLYIISNNNREARSLRDNIVDDLKEAENTFAGAGIKNIGISTTQEFTQDMILFNQDVTEINTDDADEFEEEIFDMVKPISEGFARNQIVNFGDHPQNREYDLLFAPTPDNILHISLKNYAGVDEEPSKEDVISDPRDIASLLGADMTISVAHGIEDDEKMASFRREAELRDEIIICTKDACLSRVKSHIEDTMIPPLLGTGALTMYTG